MVDGVDQHRHAERIRQQDEFLTVVVAHLSGTRQEIDPGFPFRLGRFDLPDEGMQVADQRFADLPHAIVRGVLDALQDRVGNCGLVKIAHVRFP